MQRAGYSLRPALRSHVSPFAANLRYAHSYAEIEIPRDKRIISIDNGSFYHEHPSSTGGANLAIASGFNFVLGATPLQDVGRPLRKEAHWAIIGANPTPVLDILRGQFICDPPNARSYPYLSSDEIAEKSPHLRVPSRAIQYAGFNTTSGLGGSGGVAPTYLSARYESRREETDWTVAQYLKGQTELNASEELAEAVPVEDFSFVVEKLRLGKLLDMPVSNLSNGQTRRSRIAKAILKKPQVLLLDEPFMGLDPPTLITISPMLQDLAYRSSPLLLLGLRPQDPIPDWITHVAVLGQNNTFLAAGRIAEVLYRMYCFAQSKSDPAHAAPFEIASMLTPSGIRPFTAVQTVYQTMQNSTDPHVDQWKLPRKFSDYLANELHNLCTTSQATPLSQSTASVSTSQSEQPSQSDPLIELNSIILKYGPKTILGHPPPQPPYTEPGLNLTVSRSTRLLILGPNGSGKTTLLSLLTSDHPQSYSLPIRFFGRTRLPERGTPGLSLWEIQSRIGHSSPEVHAFFPKGQTVRRVLESAWAETFSSRPEIDEKGKRMVEHFLRVFQPELCQTQAMSDADSLEWASDRERHPVFGGLSFGTQRLLLLLRAIIKQPNIVILDEGFSGMSSAVRDKALGWLERGDRSLPAWRDGDEVVFPGLTERQALIVVSHVREEIPDSVNEWIRLPSEEEATEMNKPIMSGRSEHGYIKSVEGWNHLWGC